MNKKIMSHIIDICPSEELKRALVFEDYESAIDILEVLYITFDPYDSEFGLFNAFYESVEREDKEKLKNVIDYANHLFFITCALDILKYEIDENKENFHKRYPDLANKVTLSKMLISRSSFLTDEVLDEAANEILSRKDQKYQIAASLEQVLSLNINEKYASTKSDYLEALIHSNPFTVEDLLMAILYGNYDALMSSYELMKSLKINYIKAKQGDIKDLETSIDLIRTIGLDPK